MNKIVILSGVVCASVLWATGAFAALVGVQPGTSKNPQDNVPKEIQRDNVSGGDVLSGGSGPGTRGNVLTGSMEKEKPQPVTRQRLEQNAEQGGGAALAAEELKEKSDQKSQKARMGKPHKSAPTRDTRNDGPKKDPKLFRQESSDNTVQGQGLVNKQPMNKQQPANRPATERGAGAN